MCNLIENIAQANEEEIGQILVAAIERYGVLFPGWEFLTLSLDNSLDRNEQLDRAIHLLETMKTFPE